MDMWNEDEKKPDFDYNQIEGLIDEIKKSESNVAIDNLLMELLFFFYSSKDGLYIVDANGITVRVNKAFEEITGISAKKMINRNVNDLVREGFFDQSVAAEVLKSKKPTTIIQKYQNGNTALVTGTPNIDSSGQIKNIVSNVRDISELNKLYDDLSAKERLIEQYSEYISELDHYKDDGIIAYSESMKTLMKTIRQVAKSDSSILFLGESGVGKTMFARYLWKLGGDLKKPFIAVNCAAIPQTLIESELFGYVRGAFTGAERSGKEGLIQSAKGGILFLDEVSQIPFSLQAKLLGFLESKEVTKIGSVKPDKVDVRILSATNENLEKLVETGEFREDLYYRLNVIPLQIKPIRERREDILPTVNYFLNELNKKASLNKSIDKDLMDKLIGFSWPGNVRQIRNIVERIYVMSNGNRLTIEDLPKDIEQRDGRHNHLCDLPNDMRKRIQEIEKIWIKEAIEKGGSVREAAKILGVPPTTLFRKYKGYL